MVIGKLQTVVRRHLGDEIPPLYDLSRNVSFILQNSHFSVSYPRAFMPNVAEIACIHCKPAQPLPNVRKSNVIILVTFKIANISLSAGFGRFHFWSGGFRLHLCEYGIECQSRKHAREFASAARQHLRQVALSRAVEVRIDNHSKRLAAKRQNLSMAAPAGCSGP